MLFLIPLILQNIYIFFPSCLQFLSIAVARIASLSEGRAFITFSTMRFVSIEPALWLFCCFLSHYVTKEPPELEGPLPLALVTLVRKKCGSKASKLIRNIFGIKHKWATQSECPAWWGYKDFILSPTYRFQGSTAGYFGQQTRFQGLPFTSCGLSQNS